MTTVSWGGCAPPTPPPHDVVAARTKATDVEVLVITTPSCHHCRAMQPVLDRLTEAYASSMRVERIDAAIDADRVDALGVKAAPTVILRVAGIERARLVGRVSDRDLELFFAHTGNHRLAPVDAITRAAAGIALIGVGWLLDTTVLSVVGAALTIWAAATMWRWSR